VQQQRWALDVSGDGCHWQSVQKWGEVLESGDKAEHEHHAPRSGAEPTTQPKSGQLKQLFNAGVILQKTDGRFT